ncbi:gliding motility-associated C-terminal domain-containing protein [Flavobacterium pectinovorum]|uniref:Ig-like domain-containing protein n=1 Tax=Flavobacterium pectinovorum TaxID=29533 RepID=UPI001FAE574A|nr:gliding motility-associated C-terminal domain-containing protein [Flavobacterium pectinovorum]MCI9845089.1 gliding motility-associated C-terminal domain-containing protein [Flavobacterium pectinovorum]
MKKKLQITNLNFQRGLFGALFFLLLFSNSFAQNVCRPTSQTNSTGGFLCAGMSVSDPDDAFDTSMSTFATISNVLGLACFAQETLTFNQTAKAGDQIVIYFGTGGGLLNLSLLSNVTIQAKLSGANVDDPVALNNGLLNLQLLPGNQIAVIRYTLPGDTNQVRIQVGGLLSALVNLRVYDVRLDFAKPTVTNGLIQTVCSGNSLNLSATPVAGTTLAWYSSATSTTPLATGNNYTTPILTADTTYYLGVTRAAGCEGSERVPVHVNVSNPVAPVISASGTSICSSGITQQTTLFVINPIPGTTYNWYNVSSNGVSLASGTTYSPTVPLGTTSFYVEAVIGSCLSPARTQVDIISTAIPSVPTVLTQSVTIQSGQNATLNATTSEVGVTLNWYDVASGGSAIAINSPTFTTPVLTASKTYYIESQSANGNCVSARVPVVVNLQPAALGGCLAASSQQTNRNGLCLLCGVTDPNNSVDGNSATATRLTVPVGLLTGWIQQTLQFNNPGRAGDIVDVELELPGGLADVALLGAVSLATYNGVTYNNDRVLINNSLIILQLLSGNRFKASVEAGAAFDRVEIRLGGLATVLTSLDIYQATYRYKSPTGLANRTICSGQTTTITANIGVGETINWFDVASGGTSLGSTTSYTTSALTVPTTYYVEITRNGCVNSVRFPVLISIDNPIAPVISTAGTTICSGQTTTLNIQAPVGGTVYKWYDAASSGNLVFTGTSFTTPNLIANTNYFVEATIGSCSSATRTPVTVTVNPLPAAPIAASSNVVIQSGQSVALLVSSPDSNVTFDWYDVPTNGTALATGTNTYTTPVLTLNKTYYVTARGITSGCTSSARTAINVLINNSASNCLQANSQVTTLDPGLLCVLCSFSNPGGSVDTNVNTFTRLSTVAGIAGAYVEQVVTFPTTGQTGDIIEVELELPGGLADVSLLGGVSLATYNGGTYNNDRRFLTNSLLSLQLLSGDRFKASFIATASFNKVEIRLGGLVTLLTNLDIYGASYRFKDAVVTGATSPICSGQTANLAASSGVGGETFKWYDAASAGAELSPIATYTTPALTATTTYYLEATRDGTCVNSVRQPVTVTVSPFATAADVTINTPLEASCAGSVVLSPTSALVGAQFKYYTDQNKAQEIITGSTVVGQPGVTFSKNPTTGVLTINGLSSAVPSYNYYVSVVNAITCENAINTLKQVTVNSPSATPLVVIGTTLQGCGTVNLANAITGFDTTGNTTYTFYDPSDNILPAAAAANINTSGVYSIQAQGNGVTCPSGKLPVTVSVNPLPSLVVANPFLSVNVGTNILLNATSNGTLAWFNPQGNPLTGPVFTTGVLNTPGIYTYTVVATSALNCSTSATITINVIDPNSCQLLTERVYATGESSDSIVTGGVVNGTNAIDGNTQTYSTIVTGVGLLGVGTTWQDLTWPTNIVKGTPVTVKLGAEYSLLAVAQGLSVVGTKSGVPIGVIQPVSGALLNLLPGEKSYEFTFVPANSSGPQDYDGIRVISGPLLSVAQNTKVFDAYYTRKVSTVACTPGDIQDVFYGATDLGIGALTSTVGVSDAWNVADNDISTYATMYSGVGVLAAADLTVTFKTPSIVSDTLRLVVSKPGALLNVNLLTGFSIQRYLGNVAVGAPIQSNSTLLNVTILPGNTMATVLVSSLPEAYDRVRIRFGGVAGVLEFLRVHTVERVANTKVIGSDSDNKITVCPGTDVTLETPTDACSNYIWYDSPTGGSVVANGITFAVPATLAAGIYKYYVQPVRYGCEALSRGEVTIEVRASSPENALTNITLNGAAVTSICSPTGTVTLNTSLSGTPSLTNPVYYWYNFDGTTSQLIASQTTSQLIRNGLTPGTYTYYVGVSSDEFCETAAADRKQITFTILPPSVQNDILVDDTTVCHNVQATLTPTSILSTPVFYWYFDANKTQPITNGTVSGVTYAISSTGILSVTGLTRAVSPVTYYVGVSSDTTCENIGGTLQTATVIINDPLTPTTTDDTQDFCLVNAPKVSNIQVNETNVVWYNSLTSTTAIAPATALANGIYYGAILDPITGCESSVRLQVTVTINDSGTPTTTDDTQDFCLVNAPKVSNIQVNQSNVVWYNSLTSTTAIAPTTALTNGIYYGAILDPVTGCESAVRLQVTVTVTNPLTPTTTDDTQDFCLVNAPKVSNIQVTQSNVVWYNSLTSTTAIAPTTALTNGIYYGAILDPVTGCESAVRLQVTVTVTNPLTPTTTDDTQDFCLVNAPKVSNIQVNETNVVWYNSLTSTTAIAPTTALANGIYYGAILDPLTGCESSVRLQVTVTINDSGTPTTTDDTQDFCLVNAPKVSNIQVNQSNVVWYNSLTSTTAIAPTTALTNGIYYGAILDPLTGCESAVRLQVTVTVTNPLTPTTTDDTQDFCLVNAPKVSNIQVTQSNVVWYNSLTSTTAIAPTTALANGIYYGAILDPVTGCESSVRLQVTVTINDPGTPTTTDDTQDFCLVNAPKVSNIQVNETNVVWYNSLTSTTAIAPTTALANGIYYGAILDPITGCESSVRLQVTVTINDSGTPTTTDDTQDFCLVNAPKVSNIQVNQSNVVWYNSLTSTTAIAPTTALTNGIYYGAILDPVTGCESAVRLQVTVTVTNPLTPTTTDDTQDFCLVNAPKVSNIQVTQSNVVWYNSLTSTTAIAPTTALANGIYYGAILDPVTGCESAVRLQVTVTINDPGTPTTIDDTQDFCLINAPKVSDIQVNETNVVWYNSLTSTTAIAPTTALTNGIYYGAILDPVTGCESAVRLQVTVTINDPGTPTTNDDTQDFCISKAPTVANIQVNETNVVWYGTLTSTTAIAPATPLVNGIYYGAILNPMTGCESSTRLQVTVTINNPTATPTTNSATQDFCSINTPTVANIQVNEANVVWYSNPIGGTALPATTTLATGLYYGAISSIIGCENAVRLMVTVNVNTPGVVTTTSTTQKFCLSKAPTIANIQVNEPNVVWFSTPAGGTPLALNTPLTATTYYATLISNTTNGCANATRLAIAVSFENDALAQITSSDDTPCVFQGVTYSIANGKSNYVWSVTNGTITSGGGTADGSATISWSDVGSGTVTVTYINTCDETTTKTLNVTVATCSDLTITKTVNNPTPNFGDEVTFTITVNNVGQGTILNTLVSELIPSGYELVSSSTSSGVYDTLTQIWTIPTLNAGESETLEVRVIVLPNGDYLNVATIEISTPLDVNPANNSASASVEPICLTVYNEFTPNNDGANDLFRIDCIESYPNNELKVFNRYGALVYSKRGYQNDWNGTANVSGVINRGDMLPTGTYFYVIEIGDGKVKKGWLSIMR